MDGPAPGPAPQVLAVDLGAGVRAGFTVRVPTSVDPAGGNLGLGLGEEAGTVLARRRALAGWAGAPLAWPGQVHGTAVLVLPGEAAAAAGTARATADGSGALLAAAAADGRPLAVADAVVVGRGLGAAVVVADCVPVLLADAGAGVGAAVHAGRQGLADGVLQQAVAAMLRAGARPDGVRAAIGPAVCGACYEVPAAMRDEVADVVPGVASRTSWGTPALDLPAGAAAVLAGVGVTRVRRTGWCTRTDRRFFSHRRTVSTGDVPGRCAGVVAVPAGPGVSDRGAGGPRC